MSEPTDKLKEVQETNNKLKDILARQDQTDQLSTDMFTLAQASITNIDMLLAIIKDLSILAEEQDNLHQEAMYISGQAFLCLELLKKHNITDSTEIEAEWKKIVQEQFIDKMKDVQDSSQPTSVAEDLSYQIEKLSP